MLTAVLDTSVYISSLLKKQGVPAQVLNAWRAHRFQVVTSLAIVEEVRTTLTYDRIRRRYPLTDADIDEFLATLLSDALVVPGAGEIGDVPLRDAEDAIILACIADAHADLLVTSDKDLLVLEVFQGVPIITPRQFLDGYLAPPQMPLG